MPEEIPDRPGYNAPASVPLATRDQQKPMIKMVGRMLKMKKPNALPRKSSSTGRKGLQANQSVPITHKRIFY